MDYKEAIALYTNTKHEQEAADDVKVDVIAQLLLAAAKLKSAEDQLVEADFQLGRIWYRLWKNGFEDILLWTMKPKIMTINGMLIFYLLLNFTL